MRMNSTKEEPIKLNSEAIEDVSSFTYLGSVIAVTLMEEVNRI